MRRELISLLEGGQAHAPHRRALEGVSPEVRNRRAEKGVPSVYEELEHMRIAQEDIIRYTLDPDWESPPWPEGYWPPAGDSLSDKAWHAARDGFLGDLAELIRWVSETDTDLTSAVPHGEGRTYLRQVLLVADHNAYHSGQIVQTRKILGDWPVE
jgi:uncharacterized damage-inducible protein DinB